MREQFTLEERYYFPLRPPITRWRTRWRYVIMCAVLVPVLTHNYRLRGLGLAPDKMHWADILLYRWGYVLRPKAGR